MAVDTIEINVVFNNATVYENDNKIKLTDQVKH